MSLRIAALHNSKPGKKSRAQLLALVPDLEYDDGRTKQCHADECDINKIMARFDQTGTISHVNKHAASYADFSDFDFHKQTQLLTRGREIFDDLNAELRREFGQSPAAFFAYVNDPANAANLKEKLGLLDKPGQQLPNINDADTEAALEAAQPPVVEPTPATPSAEPAAPAGDG